MSTPVEWALTYAAAGRVVMPLGRMSNRPHRMLGKFGSFDTVGSTSSADIIKWWGDDPAANIGVVTGSRSGVVVLDVDAKRVNGHESLIEWCNDLGVELPDTPVTRTPSGGVHIWFSLPHDRKIPKKVGWLPGVDFCADGCQVAVAPSVREIIRHSPEGYAPSTRSLIEYEWIILGELAEAPEYLLQDALERPPTITYSLDVETRSFKGELPKLEWFKEYGFGPHTGSRNCDCLRLARRRLRETQGNRQRVSEEIREVWEKTPGHESFSWWEVERVIDSAERYWVSRVEQANEQIKILIPKSGPLRR